MLWKEICNLYLVTDLYSLTLKYFYQLITMNGLINGDVVVMRPLNNSYLTFQNAWLHSDKCRRTFFTRGSKYINGPPDDYDCKCNR